MTTFREDCVAVAQEGAAAANADQTRALTDLVLNGQVTPDPALTSITFDQLQTFKSPGPATPPGLPNWIINYFPPQHNTEALWVYLLGACRSVYAEMYGWSDTPISDALAARMTADPTFGRVMVNHDGFANPGAMHDHILKYPVFRGSDRFILGTGEGQPPTGKYPDRIMHRKAAIFDDCWLLTGSTNLDDSSTKYQGNTVTLIYHPGLAAEAKNLFNLSWAYNTGKGPTYYRIP